MIAITGAAGFIGSCLLGHLNKQGFENIIIADDFSRKDKIGNIGNKKFSEKIDRDEFIQWLKKNPTVVTKMYHLGARTDTTEFNTEIFNRLNLNYSKEIWLHCSENNIPLVYASSAATYGPGESGFDDSHQIVNSLKPLNPYGISKNEFDKWVISQTKQPPFWAGLKFFNVYGPNEYHKGRMASVVLHAYHQINNSGSVKLFRSHHALFEDGKQLRDFIYVKDVIEIINWMMNEQPESGLYNSGTGHARTFFDLAINVFHAMNKKEKIIFIDIPEDIRNKYQYYTEAKMDKLRHAGFVKKFFSLEEGIHDYVKNYLELSLNY
jgi:ADP-L-glycero-D-manno-heptose 6-epimerase